MSGSCAFDLGWSICELTAGSNLRVSGLYYLISPSSVLGRLVGRIAPPVRYLNMGAAWALNTKYKGAANVNSTGGRSSTLNTYPPYRVCRGRTGRDCCGNRQCTTL